MVRSDDELSDVEGMSDVEDMHVLDVVRDPDVGGGQGLVVLDVESDADLTGCPDCGVVAIGHDRHVQALHDARTAVARPLFAVHRAAGTSAGLSGRQGIVTDTAGLAEEGNPPHDLDLAARLISA
ncbi:hypothetical protein [Streptomyces sp. x-80]|uniref:hypothetical protein n=1 Tax=Streptomyces sp. x-80 TaxID=2789282 RepID=UPI00397FF561